jgi:hypothetical protein
MYELNLYKTHANVSLQRDNTHRIENTKFRKYCKVFQGLSRHSSVMANVTKIRLDRILTRTARQIIG